MVTWARREPLLAGAVVALPVLFVFDFLSDDVFIPNFFIVPIVFTAALGRPRVTLLLGGAALVLSLLALVRVDDESSVAVAREILLVVSTLAAAWVARIVDRSRTRLYEQEERMRTLAENASDIVLRCTPEGVIEWVSPSVHRQLGFDPEDMVGQPLASFIHPEDVEAAMGGDASRHSRQSSRYRARFQTRSGGSVWMEVVMAPVMNDGLVVGRVGSARDIDRQVRLEEDLRTRAMTDDLTGATRRAEALRQLESLQHVRRRTGHNSAVIFCDIDLFKAVNDTYGHAGGDEVLREVAARFRKNLREEDSVARFGGDEFVVILASIHSMADAQRIAAKLHRSMLPGIDLPDGRRVHVSLSMGLAEAHPDETISDVLNRADAALYEAKNTGRDRVVCAS